MSNVVAFNKNTNFLPGLAAHAMRLPVASLGLREILEDRFREAMNDIAKSGGSPLEKIDALDNVRAHLQEKLDLIGACAQGYFRKNQVPADVACALLGVLTGDMAVCAWQEKDAKEGWGMYQCTGMLKGRVLRDPQAMRDETNPQWRKIIFIRQVQLLHDLRNSFYDLGNPGYRVNPRTFPAYRTATDIVWPKSPLSAEISKLAKRFKNYCNPAYKRPVRKAGAAALNAL